MSILAFGTSLAAFITGSVPSGLSVSTSSAELAAEAGEGVAIATNSAQVLRLPFAAASDVWVDFSYYQNGSWPSAVAPILVLSSGGTDLFRLNVVASSGSMFRASYWNGSGWTYAAAAAGTAGSSSRVRFALHVRISDSGGVIDLYKDGALVASFEGDTQLTAATTVDSARFSSMVSARATLSAMMVADEDTRAITYIHRRVNGAGAVSDWGGASTAVDETGIDDTDLIQSDTADEVSTFAKAALPTAYASGYDVVGVGVVARARKGASGPDRLQLVARSGSTNGFSGDRTLDGAFAPASHVFHQNPATSAAWTYAEADAAQPGVKSIKAA